MRDGRLRVANHVQQMSANCVKTIVAGNPTVFEHFEQVQTLGGALRKAEIILPRKETGRDRARDCNIPRLSEVISKIPRNLRLAVPLVKRPHSATHENGLEKAFSMIWAQSPCGYKTTANETNS
jgi:hypothetical protein